MKLLLLALLSGICSGDNRRSRSSSDNWIASLDEREPLHETIRRSPWHFAPRDHARLENDDASEREPALRDARRRVAHSPRVRFENPRTHHAIRHTRRQFRSMSQDVAIVWPVKKEAVVEGDLILGGLMMVHEREDTVTCGPVMPQGGVQALEAMLFTLDKLNGRGIVPGVKIGAHILDDCDKDTYGLEMAVDFIKGSISNIDGAEYHCNKTSVRKVISGVVGAASSVTSIQVANLLRLFRIPQVSNRSIREPKSNGTLKTFQYLEAEYSILRNNE